MKEEIYSIRFNKAVLRDGDIHFTTYTLGMPIVTAAMSTIIPISIILKGEKIEIAFDNKTKHILHYRDDVELFTREKEEKDGTDTDTQVKSKRIRERKDSK